MLRPAILRALPQVEPRLARLDPHLIRVVGNQVGLAGQARHPEAVIGIGGERGEEGALANWHMQLICGDYFVARVPILPPEPVPDDSHLERALSAWGILDAEDDSRRCEEQHHDDDDWSDGPRKLHLGASINLSRLAAVVGGWPPALSAAVSR